jgi:hypothetical protein
MKCTVKIRPLDYAALIFAAALTAGSAIFVYTGAGNENNIVISGPGGGWIFPQEAEEIVAVPGPLGNTVIEVKNYRVRVLSSPCANQSCVAAGTIHSYGQWIACLPNKVLVSVESKRRGAFKSEDEVDGTVW